MRNYQKAVAFMKEHLQGEINWYYTVKTKCEIHEFLDGDTIVTVVSKTNRYDAVRYLFDADFKIKGKEYCGNYGWLPGSMNFWKKIEC